MGENGCEYPKSALDAQQVFVPNEMKISFAANLAILGTGRVVEVSGKANRPQARPIPRYRVTILFSLPSLSTLFFSRGSVFAAASLFSSQRFQALKAAATAKPPLTS